MIMFLQFFLALPFWRLWVNQFNSGSELEKILQQMARQNFRWNQLRTSLRFLWLAFTIVSFVGILFVMHYIKARQSWRNMLENDIPDTYISAFQTFDILCDTVGTAARLYWALMSFIHTWLVY